MDPALADIVEVVRKERQAAVTVEDRTIRLTEPVKGDPGSAVLRLLGLAQLASPVGVAAHSGPERVAAGVWRSPDLYLARWTGGRRWVVGYRLSGGARPNDYVRTEGRIPTRLETGSWYGDVPEDVHEAFLDAGLLLEEPPFEVARPSVRPAPTGPRRPAPERSRPTRPRPATAPSRKSPLATALCPECRMYKAPGQFVPGDDRCVDCR